MIVLATLTIRREAVWASDIRLWEDTAQKAPNKARVWFNLGGAYLNTDPEKARAALLRALELQPHFVEAWYDLGVIEQGKQNWDAALAYYGTAVQEQPAYWPAWNNMANTLFALGQQDRALTYLRQTLDLNPNYWPAQYNTAIVHFVRGRYADAIPRLRIVLDWQPEFRDARYLLATSLARAGDRVSADEEFKKLGGPQAKGSGLTPTMILAPSRP
jgi:superkiller protein 3